MAALRRKALLTTTLIAVLPLAGCSPTKAPPPRRPLPVTGSSTVTAATSSKLSPAAPEAVIPSAFDSTKGWQVSTDSAGTTFDNPTVAPVGGLVLLLATSADQQHVWIVAHDERTGAVRWTTRPESRMSITGVLADITPSLLLTQEGGKEYAVLAMTGTAAGDAVTPDHEVAVLDVYDTASTPTGGGVQPLRQISLDGQATSFTATRGNGLLGVALRPDPANPLDVTQAAVDTATGTVTQYTASTLTPPSSCQQCSARTGLNTMAGVTPWGPVVDSVGGSWLSGGWYSGDLKPDGANGAVTSFVAPNGSVISEWSPTDFTSNIGIWTVQDAHTGSILAAAPCDAPGQAGGAVTSDDGRFLIVGGQQAFDLKTGTGFCYQATSTSNQLTLIAVDGEDATVYGEGANNAPVSISLITAQPTPLPVQTVVPTLIGGDVAVYGTSTDNGQPIDIYPRRSS